MNKDYSNFREAISATEVSGCYQIDRNVKFNNSCAGLLRITDDMLEKYKQQYYRLKYNVSPEMFRYYVTGLLWLRNIHLNKMAKIPPNKTELEMLRMTEHILFQIPEPIFIALQAIGPVKTPSGQDLYPQAPHLPEQVVGGIGGLFGPITEESAETAILYTEYPTLGLTSEAIQASLTVIDNYSIENYNSVIAYEGHPANSNALGYYEVSKVTNELRSNLSRYGITANNFRESLVNTRFNLDFMCSISQKLISLKLFNNIEVRMKEMAKTGSHGQLVVLRPISETNQTNEKVMTELSMKLTTLAEESFSAVTIASICAFQVFREAVGEDPPKDDESTAELNVAKLSQMKQKAKYLYDKFLNDIDQLGLEFPKSPLEVDELIVKQSDTYQAHKNWIPLTYPSTEPAPVAWVKGRNQLRNLPAHYYAPVFQGLEGNIRLDVKRFKMLKSLAVQVPFDSDSD